MAVQVKSCACGTNNWVSMMSDRIQSLGHEEILWCKECGTVKKISLPHGATSERTLDYRQPKTALNTNLELVKK